VQYHGGRQTRCQPMPSKHAISTVVAHSMPPTAWLGSCHRTIPVPAQGLADDTHLQARGAEVVACLVVRRWQQLDPTLASAVIRDTHCETLPSSYSSTHQP
jgi:hypothetical protein